MFDFTKSYSQSNPIFGKCIYSTNNRELAEHGYTTPLNAIESYQIKNGEILNVSNSKIGDQLKFFVDDLIIAVKDLDKRIIHDSKGRRRAFMFVTVPGNAYLRQLYFSDRFNEFICTNNVGVYMTSSPINFKDNKADKDYEGGGYVKKAKNNFWESKIFKITDFMNIINGRYLEPNLNLSQEEINTNINILINIEQCNTGIDLPGLNGGYMAKAFDKNNPNIVQMPGRICRPDEADKCIIGNVETAAYSNNCQYIKPFGYIYIPVGLFNEEEYAELHDALSIMYFDNALKSVSIMKTDIGLNNPDEINNSNKNKRIIKIIFDHKNDPNWLTKFEEHELLKNVMFGDITIFKDKISNKMNKCSCENKIKIHQMLEEFFKDKEITNYNLETVYSEIKDLPEMF